MSDRSNTNRSVRLTDSQWEWLAREASRRGGISVNELLRSLVQECIDGGGRK